MPRTNTNTTGRAVKSLLQDINFCHTDGNGHHWEQGYQYVKIATSDGDVVKANYELKIDFTVRNTMSCSDQMKTTTIPI